MNPGTESPESAVGPSAAARCAAAEPAGRFATRPDGSGETAAVVPGRTTASAWPRQRLRQSSSQAERSPSCRTFAGPTTAASSARSVMRRAPT